MNPLQTALRLLVFVVIFFLLALIIWLFYCRCVRRGALEPGQPGGYAVAELHRA
jgi:hypothetical protein